MLTQQLTAVTLRVADNANTTADYAVTLRVADNANTTADCAVMLRVADIANILFEWNRCKMKPKYFEQCDKVQMCASDTSKLQLHAKKIRSKLNFLFC